MDNASKALIMAGAILIAVALVGVGVYLYQAATGTVASGVDQLDANKVQMLNGEIEQFEGRIKGTEAKSLIRKINAYKRDNSVWPIGIECNYDNATDITNDNAFYNVSLDYDETTGLINKVTIE